MSKHLASLMVLGMMGIDIPRFEKVIAVCYFCKCNIHSSLDHMPNPDCCGKQECRTLWREHRKTK